MVKKLSLLTVLLLAVALLFTACPIQFDPYEVPAAPPGGGPPPGPSIDPEFTGNRTGFGDGYGFLNAAGERVSVTLIFVDGQLTDVQINTPDETPGYFETQAGAWRNLALTGSVPPLFPNPRPPGSPDAFSSATYTVNGLTEAFLAAWALVPTVTPEP